MKNLWDWEMFHVSLQSFFTFWGSSGKSDKMCVTKVLAFHLSLNNRIIFLRTRQASKQARQFRTVWVGSQTWSETFT